MKYIMAYMRAPELNSVGQLWNFMKWTKFANDACVDSHELHAKLKPLLWQTRLSLSRLRSVLAHRTTAFINARS
jgi:hypothetical protein